MHSNYNSSRQYKRPHHTPHDRNEGLSSSSRPIPQSAYIQAYEAQLAYGQAERAEDLYAKGGRGLMRWQGEGDDEIWADRHDIIHLLTDLPSTASSSRIPNRAPSLVPSPTSSWASLPSDLEETFQMSDPEEIAEYERTKRLSRIASLRETRLREREEEDRQVQSKIQSAVISWPEEEIPPHATLTLMQHTAASLLKSPNPRVLESRILMNHTSDERFEFLRGRWKLTWERTKKDAKAKHDLQSGKNEKEKKSVGSLIGGYESSDEDEDEEENDMGELPSPSPPPPPPPDIDLPPLPDEGNPGFSDRDGLVDNEAARVTPVSEEEDRQKFRRLKAEEWKRKRAEAKS